LKRVLITFLARYYVVHVRGLQEADKLGFFGRLNAASQPNEINFIDNSVGPAVQAGAPADAAAAAE